jgi:hypothetical protein
MKNYYVLIAISCFVTLSGCGGSQSPTTVSPQNNNSPSNKSAVNPDGNINQIYKCQFQSSEKIQIILDATDKSHPKWVQYPLSNPRNSYSDEAILKPARDSDALMLKSFAKDIGIDFIDVKLVQFYGVFDSDNVFQFGMWAFTNNTGIFQGGMVLGAGNQFICK